MSHLFCLSIFLFSHCVLILLFSLVQRDKRKEAERRREEKKRREKIKEEEMERAWPVHVVLGTLDSMELMRPWLLGVPGVE